MLCDSVVSAEGKLYVQGGGWNVLNAITLPTRHPRIGLAIIIRVPYTATNQMHEFAVRLEDSDGGPLRLGEAPAGFESEDGFIRSLGGQFNVGRPPNLQPGDEQIVPIAINLDGLLFETAGGYQVVIAIDGTDVKVIPLRVIPMPFQLNPMSR